MPLEGVTRLIHTAQHSFLPCGACFRALARLSRSVGRARAFSQGGSLAERFGLSLAESRGDHGHHRLSGYQGDPDLPPTVRCVWNEPMDFVDDPQRMDMRGLTVLQLLAFVVYEEVLTVREVKQVVRHDGLPRSLCSSHAGDTARCDETAGVIICSHFIDACCGFGGARTGQPGRPMQS